jgi:hypothetical protein
VTSNCGGGTFTLTEVHLSACTDECPDKFYSDDPTITCIRTDAADKDPVLHFRFTGIVNDVAALVGTGYKGRFGATEKIYPYYDADDAWAIQGRGMYFKGTSEFHMAKVTGYVDTSVVINPAMSVEIWARPKANALGTLFYKGKEDGTPVYVLQTNKGASTVVFTLLGDKG